MTTARDVMTRGTEYVERTESVQQAARRLATGDIGLVLVCDDDGRLQGVVTDRDIVVKVVAEGKDPAVTSIGEVADQDDVVTVAADDDLHRAVDTMKAHKVRRLPVVEGDQLVGVLSQGDLAGTLSPDELSDLLATISS